MPNFLSASLPALMTLEPCRMLPLL